MAAGGGGGGMAAGGGEGGGLEAAREKVAPLLAELLPPTAVAVDVTDGTTPLAGGGRDEVGGDVTSAARYVLGRTKVFFRAGALDVIERARSKLLATNARRLQTATRRRLCVKRYAALRSAALRVQTAHRCHVAQARLTGLRSGKGSFYPELRVTAQRLHRTGGAVRFRVR